LPPALSILVPTYNRHRTLREAVASALAQTVADVEVVVCDDASTDATPAAAAELTAADPRVRYLRHPRNLGIAGNWRAAIAAAAAPFFCLLHDDDALEPTFANRLLAPLSADPSLVLSFCDHWVMGPEGRRLPAETDATTRRFGRADLPPGRVADFAAVGLVRHAIPVGAAVFRRSAVDPASIPDEASGAADMWLVYQCVRSGLGAWYVPDRLMNYRSHAGGMSASAPLAMSCGHVFRYERMLVDPAMAAIHPVVRERLAEARVDRALALVEAGRGAEARRASVAAFRGRPGRRSLAAVGLALVGPLGCHALRRWRRRP